MTSQDWEELRTRTQEMFGKVGKQNEVTKAQLEEQKKEVYYMIELLGEDEKRDKLDPHRAKLALSITFNNLAQLINHLIIQHNGDVLLFTQVEALWDMVLRTAEQTESKVSAETVETLRESIASSQKQLDEKREVELAVPENIESELAEWFAERERAKKAQSEYVK